jgi:hypothetical protein
MIIDKKDGAKMAISIKKKMEPKRPLIHKIDGAKNENPWSKNGNSSIQKDGFKMTIHP